MKALLITLAILLMSLPIIGFAQSNTPPASADKIDWPAEYDPAKSKFFVHNEIEINAMPEVVWPILIDALKWPTWYKGAKDLVLINAGDSLLGANSVFRWQTMGLTFESTIKAFEPDQLLAWESKKKSIQGYHVWLILPTATGCKVITEESQNGWLTFFEKTSQGKKLKRLHDVWLSELKKKAEQGDTGSLYDPNIPNGLTQAERQQLINQLQMPLAKFNVTVADLSPEQLSFRTKSDKWTLAE